jgi:hypothetical protein
VKVLLRILEERLGDENAGIADQRVDAPGALLAPATTLCAVAPSRMLPAIASPCSSLEEAIDRELATTRSPSLR